MADKKKAEVYARENDPRDRELDDDELLKMATINTEVENVEAYAAKEAFGSRRTKKFHTRVATEYADDRAMKKLEKEEKER